MSEVHVIGWDTKKDGVPHKMWYAGRKVNSSRNDSFGSNPTVTIKRTAFIEDAVHFDTFIEAYEVYNSDKIRVGGHAYIRYLTDKEIFKMKLEGG